jgi:hypothetical protein
MASDFSSFSQREQLAFRYGSNSTPDNLPFYNMEIATNSHRRSFFEIKKSKKQG